MPKIGFVPSVNWPPTVPKLSGSGSPARRLSIGLGSNVSIELGAPTLKMKMTASAVALKCGRLARSGFAADSANAVRASKCCRASAPNPLAARNSRSRREVAPRVAASLGSVDEFIAVQQGEREIVQRMGS